MGWGTLWGLGWGGGLGAPFSVLALRAKTNRSVELEFTMAPWWGSRARTGSAANPRQWVLTEVATSRRIQVLEAVSTGIRLVEVFSVEPWQEGIGRYRIDASGLLNASELPIGAPTGGTFDGLVWDRSKLIAPSDSDFKNPQNVQADGSIGGQLMYDSGGDFQREGGIELLRKLLIRRLTQDPDSYFHLETGTEFGLGLRPKKQYAMADLLAIKSSSERQARREPGVRDVRAAVSLDSHGILNLRLYVQLESGQTVPVNMPVLPAGGVP